MAYLIATGDVAKPVFLVDPATGIAYSAAGGTGGSASQVQGNIAAGVANSGNPVGVGAQVLASPTGVTFVDGTRQYLTTNISGSLYIAAPDGGATAGNDNVNALVGIGTRNGGSGNPKPMSVGVSNFNGSGWDRAYKPNAVSRITSSAASTNATLAKNATGNLFLAAGYNSNAAVRYLKIYNKASAPTVGTDTPVLTFALPPTGAFAIDLPSQYFTVGIAYALTTGSADSDTGAVAANDILGLNIAYA